MADIVTKFQVSFWDMTKTYECKGKFPDGATFNLNSKEDLGYVEWQEKIKTAWEAHIKPEPPAECICDQCEVDEKEYPRLKVAEVVK